MPAGLHRTGAKMSNTTITIPSNISEFSLIYTSTHPWTVKFKKQNGDTWSGIAGFVNSDETAVTTAKFFKDNLSELWNFIFEEIPRVEREFSTPTTTPCEVANESSP